MAGAQVSLSGDCSGKTLWSAALLTLANSFKCCGLLQNQNNPSGPESTLNARLYLKLSFGFTKDLSFRGMLRA